MMKFIIEHLEPELFEWCIAEYEEISRIVGKQNLIFTNIKKDAEKLKNFGRVEAKSVSELELKNACVLDPEAEKELSFEDKFNYLIFGGILGDNPPKKRTKAELTNKIKNAEKRNLGKKQMSTDTAVAVAKIITEGKKLSQIKFIDNPEIEIKKGESVQLPYRYISNDEKPIIPDKIIEILKRETEF